MNQQPIIVDPKQQSKPSSIEAQIRARYKQAIGNIAPKVSRQLINDLDTQALAQAARLTAQTIAPVGTLSRWWHRRALLTVWFSIPSSLTLLTLAATSNHHDFIYCLIALGLAINGYGAAKSNLELAAVNRLIFDKRATRAAIRFEGEMIEDETFNDAPSFNWHEVTSFVHLAIVGESGSGKSTLTQWLINQFNGDTQIYDSDAAPYDWQGLKVIGKAANYAQIAAAMEADLEALQRRTERRARGDENFTPIIRVLEEAPETLSNLHDSGYDVGYRWLKALLRRGRKYKMKILLLGQDVTVESLKIKGEGSLRNNFKTIRLGEIAVEYARSLKDDAILNNLLKLQRPALLGKSKFTEVPRLGG